MSPAGRKRVLVVDDADDLRELLAIALSRAGFDVVGAEGGDAATHLLATEAEAIDAVVLDIQMPDMDGWEVLGRIRSEPGTAAMPVVVCTVKGRDADVERVWEAGADAYVGKPFDIAELVGALDGLMARQTR